jgi:hypothetical protein
MKSFTKDLLSGVLLACLTLVIAITAQAATEVPAVIQQPGTQPGEVSNLESPNKCDNCHGGYNSAVEPAHNWRGSMMAHAGRDPIFWATVAIAEQDFDGAGDLCIRCHSTTGWLAGRSTPTDGSGLAASDSDGVDCDFCHSLTNPDGSEHTGVMNQNFIANEPNQEDPFDWDEPNRIEGYYGSGIASMWGGSDKLGPYNDAEARHQFMQSKFHRDRDFCGTCHDVSNPAVGELAHNHGAQATAEAVVTGGGNPGNPANDKVAFNNPPYAYGIVERTFSEYKSGMISQTLVNDYASLPEDLRGGALEAAYNAATQNGTIDGNYKNPPMPRYFSCQTCHMRAVKGTGANKNGVPVRDDLPLHDLTGGNYWMPEAIEYLDSQGKLRLGGGMSADLITAMLDGALRAREQLSLAASLSAQTEGNNVEVKVVNHTGHKLISGYPEGRRMWLNIKWYDGSNTLLREDGEYGEIGVTVPNPAGGEVAVKSLLDLDNPNTKIYEAHMGMTQDWAQTLMSVNANYYEPIVLDYDRTTGAPGLTIGALAEMPSGTTHETFHFVLNNTVIKDNRIPPYEMEYESARVRNALPEPSDQYGGTPGGTYNYYDEVLLTPPPGAVSATIELLYQPTSWEYIQFLNLANNTAQGEFLADEGKNMLEAWLNTGMAEPHVMTSTTWGDATGGCNATTPTMLSATPGDSQVLVSWHELPAEPSIDGYRLFYDQSGKAQLVVDTDRTESTFTDLGLTNSQEYCYKVTSYIGEDANGEYDPVSGCESGFSNILCATPAQPGQQVTVPNVVGQPQADAEAAIIAENLVVGTIDTAYSETVTEGHVISQEPVGGTLLPRDSAVNLVVSLGPAPGVMCTDIPDKGACNNEPACEWQGSPKNGSCVDIVACTPTPGEETQESSCADGIDNDCDGLTDGADSDCGLPADCSVYDGNQTACKNDPACRWNKRNNLCLNR